MIEQVSFPHGSQRTALWITWERHRRTLELCQSLSIELCELTSPRSRVVRYIVLLTRTTICLLRRRPALVVVQCPSVVLGLWVALLKPLLRFSLVADLHNEAVRPFNYSSSIYESMLAFIHVTADLCLVSNEHLIAAVEQSGGKAFVLPDKLPDLRPRATVPASPTRSVVFVCTYAPDEPFREVIEAAGGIDSTVTVFVTGSYRRVEPLHPPDNVYLTGFVSERDYLALLQMADVIVDLTSIDDCLVCGAYEAVALGKPLVTSDTAALREYFNRGTVYTKHDSHSLAAAISYALEHSDELAAEMRTLRVELARDWVRQRDALRRLLQLDEAGQTAKDLIPLPMRH
ncbi:MAG TPA: glycosyltransferase [Vicinamibacterales bacterium]|nr:glycosyltransferase [Vicinamibacterales bacterium]